MNKIQNILVIPEHTNIFDEYNTLYSKLQKKYTINIFNWNDLKSQNDINITSVTNSILDWIENQNIDLNKTLIILKGCSSLVLYNKILQLNPSAILLVSVPFAKTIINPFLSSDPSYKVLKEWYYKQLMKEYKTYKLLFPNLDDPKFLTFHNDYKKNFIFYTNYTGQLNDYLNLRNFLNFPIKPKVKTCFFIGYFDEIINVKKQIKILDNLKLSYKIFANSSHQIEFDETNNYCDEIQNFINEI